MAMVLTPARLIALRAFMSRAANPSPDVLQRETDRWEWLMLGRAEALEHAAKVKRGRKVRAVAAGTLALLSACALPTPEQQVQSLKTQMQIDDLRCRSYGFKFGDAAYGNCRMQMDQQRQFRQQQPPFSTWGMGL